MLNNEQQLLDSCKENPALVFSLIKRGEFEIIEELVEDNRINVNMVDSLGNDVVTRLLKVKQYDLVLSLMKKKNWNVNHQNEEGNTFGHVLAVDDSVSAIKVVEQLKKKKNYLPNIKNNKGETALDKALNNNHLCTAFKILEDKRFNNIDVLSFKNLFNVSIKNIYYGKYSKLNNLEIIVGNLEKKDLNESMSELIKSISNNMDVIKYDIMNDKSNILESIINNHLVKE